MCSCPFHSIEPTVGLHPPLWVVDPLLPQSGASFAAFTVVPNYTA